MGMTTTASEVIDRVLAELGELELAAPVFWAREELLDIVWEAVVDLNLITGYLQETVSIPLNANALQAAPDQIAILHMRNGSKQMERYSIDDLDTRFPAWEDEGSAAGVQRWSHVGLKQFVTHRRAYELGSSVEATVLSLHPELSESDVLEIDDEYTDALEAYVFHIARLKEGGLEFQQSMESYKEYLATAATLAMRTGWTNEPGWVQAPKSKLADAVPRRH